MLSGGSTPDLVLQMLLQGDATILVDSRIVAEYHEVTARTRFGLMAWSAGCYSTHSRRLLNQ